MEVDRIPEYVGSARANFYFPTFYVGFQPQRKCSEDEGDDIAYPSSRSTIASDALLDRLFETARAPEPIERAPEPIERAPEPIERAKKRRLLVIVRKAAMTDNDSEERSITRKILRKRRRSTNQSRGKSKIKMNKKMGSKKRKTENREKNRKKTKRSRPQN